VALAATVLLFSPLSNPPIGPFPLVAVPAALVLIAFQRARSSSLWLAAGLLVVASLGARSPTELWYAEMGWAVLLGGGLVVATAVLPKGSVFERSTLAVAFAVVAVAGVALLRPGGLADLDWRIAGQFDRWIPLFDLDGEAGAAVAEGLRHLADAAKLVYPALLVLASLAALGCAAYVERRMTGDETPLGPIRQFRFTDHLAWVLVAGLVLLLLPVGGWAIRTGGNLVTVMGALYVLRGAAVLVWLGTSVASSTWVIVLWVVAAILLYPITLGTALVMGLSDTWLDLRARLRTETEGK